MALERNKRPVDAGMKQTLFNVSFEMIALRSYAPARIRLSFEEFHWNWVA